MFVVFDGCSVLLSAEPGVEVSNIDLLECFGLVCTLIRCEVTSCGDVILKGFVMLHVVAICHASCGHVVSHLFCTGPLVGLSRHNMLMTFRMPLT